MSVQRADLMGTRHTLNITYPTPQETLAGSPTLLPTSEPATATFSYTVAASDICTYDHKPVGKIDSCFIVAGGLNTDVSNNRTLCYRIKKNSTSVYTSSAITVTANQYWTLQITLANIAVGDAIEVFLWQVTTNALNWDFNGFIGLVSRLKIGDGANKSFVNLVYTFDTLGVIFTLGTPTAWTAGSVFAIGAGNNDTWTIGTTSATRTVTAQKQNDTTGIMKLQYGDASGEGSVQNSATSRPRITSQYKITKIEWTPTNIIL